MRRRRPHRTATAAPEINLTPLIDVVFVVLIMFIVLAPLLELEQIELADAGAELQTVSANEDRPVQLHVRSDNSVWLNKQRVTIELLQHRLQEMHEQFPAARPIVYHDRRAEFGRYQEVKNALEVAGFREMDLLLQPNT